MKLILAIIQDQDINDVMEELMKNDFRVTKIASTGGFLKAGNTTLLIGVENEKVNQVISIIKDTANERDINTALSSITLPGDTFIPHAEEIRVGGATLFILDVERYERL